MVLLSTPVTIIHDLPLNFVHVFLHMWFRCTSRTLQLTNVLCFGLPFPAPTPDLFSSPTLFPTIIDAECGRCLRRTRGGLESSFRVSFRIDTSASTSATPIHISQWSLPAVVAVCGTCTSVLSPRAVGCDAASSPRLTLRTSCRPVWPAQPGSQATCTPWGQSQTETRLVSYPRL